MKKEFKCGVDRFGWVTCEGEYIMSGDNGGTIDVTLTLVPRMTHVKAIHCNGDGDIGHSRGWNPDEEGETASLSRRGRGADLLQAGFLGGRPVGV